MQNFSPKANTAMVEIDRPSHSYFIKCVAVARLVMNDMNIQIPPNLNPGCLGKFYSMQVSMTGEGFLQSRSLGVNPEYSWPDVELVRSVTLKRLTD